MGPGWALPRAARLVLGGLYVVAAGAAGAAAVLIGWASERDGELRDEPAEHGASPRRYR